MCIKFNSISKIFFGANKPCLTPQKNAIFIVPVVRIQMSIKGLYPTFIVPKVVL